MVDVRNAPLENLLNALFVPGRWAYDLFSDYQLYPYFDSSERTTKKLTARTLSSKIPGLLAGRANIAALLSALSKQWTGIDVLGSAGTGQTGLVEALYRTFESHAQERKTVLDVIEKIRLEQEANGLSLNGVQYGHSPVQARSKKLSFLGPLSKRIGVVDQQFISIRGTLCSVEAARQADMYVGKMLEGSGARWIITDFPVFLLSHEQFKDSLVVLQIQNEILDRMEAALPFDKEIGWYPYVRLYGFCQRSLSPRHPFPALACSWMEYRLPKPPGQLSDQLQRAYSGPAYVADAGFNIDRTQPVELILFIDIMRILARSVNLDLPQLRPEQVDLVRHTQTRLREISDGEPKAQDDS
ncbi:MAG: hypothetical protein M3495_17780 [Pseudomonadota bacterium]|nr:hypothetical protein [Gammaproteobacteria bacterium]MDQ3583338.1 hypothetical protein [Pseudomonadota bacterium]